MQKLFVVFVALSFLVAVSSMALGAPDPKEKAELDNPYSPARDITGTPESEPNDTCSDANGPIGLGAWDGEIDVANSADVDWYYIEVGAGDCFVFETSLTEGQTDAVDTYMRLYGGDCPDGLSLLDSDDDGGPSTYSRIQWAFADAGTYYVEIDNFGTSTGFYTLTVSECPPPLNICDLVFDGACDVLITGDTCVGGVNYNAAMGGCGGNGYDDLYSLTVLPGGSFTASVVFPLEDAVISLLDSCFEPFGCIDEVDGTFTGGTEVLTYSNGGPDPVEVFLMVDDWYTNGCGEYELTIECYDVISIQEATWGQMKNLYK